MGANAAGAVADVMTTANGRVTAETRTALRFVRSGAVNREISPLFLLAEAPRIPKSSSSPLFLILGAHFQFETGAHTGFSNGGTTPRVGPPAEESSVCPGALRPRMGPLRL